ncbi:hypothetical protein FRC18_001045, partial [Serendipita sp. 400]
MNVNTKTCLMGAEKQQDPPSLRTFSTEIRLLFFFPLVRYFDIAYRVFILRSCPLCRSLTSGGFAHTKISSKQSSADDMGTCTRASHAFIWIPLPTQGSACSAVNRLTRTYPAKTPATIPLTQLTQLTSILISPYFLYLGAVCSSPIYVLPSLPRFISFYDHRRSFPSPPPKWIPSSIQKAKWSAFVRFPACSASSQQPRSATASLNERIKSTSSP